MSKWISVDSIINKFNSHVGFTTCADVKRAIKIIQDEPGIDIVMCKECSRWDESVYGYINVDGHLCRRHMWWTTAEDYCSDGEREDR